MRSIPVEDQLRRLAPDGELRFTLRDVALDEALLALHETRFTGAADIGAMPEVDRIFFREGACVGLIPYRRVDAQLLGNVLVEMKKLSRSDLEQVLAERRTMDGLILGQVLLQRGLIDQDTLDRGCAEQARRRMFALYERPEQPVLVRAGLERLAHFHPTHVDLRPVIAYGMVVRADEARREKMIAHARGMHARLIAPYDERRNSYGLPPPVLQAVRTLAAGYDFDDNVVLPGLNKDTTAGLLLLLSRMSLLELRL